MPAKTGAFTRSNINESLAQNGLFWLGVTTGATQSTADGSIIDTGLGMGPRQRIHLKRNMDTILNITTMITKNVDTSGGLIERAESFDNLAYYNAVAEPGSNVLRAIPGKAYLTSYSLSFEPQAPIIGNFSNRIIQGSQEIEDFLEEMDEPHNTGTGREVQIYESGEIDIRTGSGTKLPGIASVNIDFAVQLEPIEYRGGVYGYFYQLPFIVGVSIVLYEEFLVSYQELFNDVPSLDSIKVGPFEVTSVKFLNYGPQVTSNGYKTRSLALAGTNLKYQK